jgi:hypothetical protein
VNDALRREESAGHLRAYRDLGLPLAALAGYRRLLIAAAGLTEQDWQAASYDVREAVLLHGRDTLISRSGIAPGEWRRLPPYSQARADVLLSGARALGITTGWTGWK